MGTCCSTDREMMGGKERLEVDLNKETAVIEKSKPAPPDNRKSNQPEQEAENTEDDIVFLNEAAKLRSSKEETNVFTSSSKLAFSILDSF
jgi:hypothetical protein